jgi:hypothetical protein
MHDNDGVEAFCYFTIIPIPPCFAVLHGSHPDHSIYTKQQQLPVNASFVCMVLSADGSLVRLCASREMQSRILHPSLPHVASTVQFVVSPSASTTPSTESVSFTASKRLCCLIFALCAHLLLCVAHRRWVGAALLAWARSVLDARGCKVGRTSGTCCLAAAFVHRCALFTVGIDAAFGEVVGATTREDEDSPAIGY